MFRALVGRANLRARKRVDADALAAAEKARERLLRIADVLEAVVSAAGAGADIAAAVTKIAPLATVAADSVSLRKCNLDGIYSTKYGASGRPSCRILYRALTLVVP